MKKRDKLQIVFLAIIFVIAAVFCLVAFSRQSETGKTLAALQQQERATVKGWGVMEEEDGE